MSSSAFEHADEADVADQLRPASYDDDQSSPPPDLAEREASEADALEQELEVGEEDGYDQ